MELLTPLETLCRLILRAKELEAQLMDMPLLAGHLEAGLAAFDYSCDGVGQND